MPLDNPFEPMIKNIGNYVTGTLYSQGTIPPINIDNYDGLALASPSDTHLLAAKDPVINEVAVGMSGNLIGSNAVTGAPPLQLSNSAGYPLQWWSVDLSPYQEGTGDPSPNNIRPIHGTNKLKLFVEESYDPSATPKAVIDMPTLSSNQWDEEWENGGYYTNNGNKWGTTERIRNVNPIKVEPNTSYYIYVGGSPADTKVLFYKADMTYISNITRNNSDFTTPAECEYVNFMTGAAYGTTYGDNIAINFPVTVTTYNPYSNTVYTGTVGINGGVSRSAYVLLNDPDKWVTATGTILFRYDADFMDRKLYPNSFTGVTCTYLPVENINDNFSRWVGASSYKFGIYSTALTLEQIKADAAAGKIAICYDLATPAAFAVPSVTVPTIKGNATAWATAEDGTVDSMRVGYIGDE